MRNIKDLKPNEAIKISTKKEARKFSNITRMRLYIGDMVCFSQNCWFFTDTAPVIIPASEFLSKKSKLKNEIATLDSRVYELELKLGIAGTSNGLNQPEALLFEPEQPLTELPEKWCVKPITNEDVNIIFKWFSKNYQTPWPLGFKEITNLESDLHLCYPKYDDYSHKIPKGAIQSHGYTEISTEEFKRLVLKEKPHNENTGKWYRHVKNGALVYFKEVGYENYGFSPDGQFTDKVHMNEDGTNWDDVSNSVVKTALINEAKKRGFKHNIEIKSNGLNVYLSEHNGLFQLSGNTLWYGGYIIFNNGIWAEIIEPAKEEIHFAINWNLQGQKFITDEELVVMNDGFTFEDKTFSGMVVKKGESSYEVGHFFGRWNMDAFRLYTGEPITLSN